MLYKSPQLYITEQGELTTDPELGELPPSLGAAAYEWMAENLVHGEGDREGEPFVLPDHFVEPLFRLYEYHPDTGRRLIKRTLIGTPKGNAKTEFAGAVIAFEFAGPCVIGDQGPEMRRSPKIVAAAASAEQAGEVYNEAFSKMVAPIKDLLDGPYENETMLLGASGKVQRVASKASTNDGKKPSVVVVDEFHEWLLTKARNHFVLTNGLTKRRDTLEFNITTAGADQDESPCKRMYHFLRAVASGEVFAPEFLGFWWQYPDEVNYDNEAELRAALLEANPAVWVRDNIDVLVSRASEIPEFEHRRYYGNQWTQTADSWMTPDAWDRRHDPNRQVEDEPVVLFFDGSYSNDSAAIVGVTIAQPHHVFVVDVWENPAFLIDQPNNDGWRISDDDIDTAMSQAMEKFNVAQLWYDPWGYHKLGKAWAERWGDDIVGAHNTKMIQSVVAPACSMMFTAVHSGSADVQISHDGNPTLRRHVGNAVTKETPDGVYIVKDGPHSPRKIDAAYAATMGLWYAAHYEEVDNTYRGSALFV